MIFNNFLDPLIKDGKSEVGRHFQKITMVLEREHLKQTLPTSTYCLGIGLQLSF